MPERRGKVRMKKKIKIKEERYEKD